MQTGGEEQLEASRSQYEEHKQKFEQWKMDNSKQKGTPSYEKYVSDFHQWESDMVKTIQRMEVGKVDAQLDKLLDEVTKQQFWHALSKMSANDKTFSSNLMNNYKRIMTSPVDARAIRPPASSVVQMAAISHPHYVPNLQGATWTPAAPVKFRVPSPVISYKNPNVMDSEDINIKLLLFDPDIVSIEDNELKNNIANEIDQVVDILPTWDVQNVSLTFDNWDARKIFKAVLPNDLDFSSFTQTGHIIHCNFRDELLPYKQIIGEILLKKVRNCRTVVNKLDGITTEYRNFDLELIAGEPSYTTAVVERGITYKMDFSKVFWNSRLQHEHERVIKLLDKNSLVFDACAGIGPFVLPAAKQKLCRVVFANDLNPESVKWMNVNIQANKLKPERIVTFNMDANEFITGPVASEISKYLSQQKSDDVLKPSGAHILMNLPAFSINFLPAFKNFLKDVVVGASSEQSLFPIWVYSYLFVKAREDVEYKWYVDKAYEMVKEKLGWADDIQDKRIDAHHVRTVSTRKEMFCMRIELLPEYIGIVNGEDPPSKRQKTN